MDYPANFEDMDNNTLRRELELRGQEVGPIDDSTRDLYLEQLARLLVKEEMMEEQDEITDIPFPFRRPINDFNRKEECHPFGIQDPFVITLVILLLYFIVDYFRE